MIAVYGCAVRCEHLYQKYFQSGSSLAATGDGSTFQECEIVTCEQLAGREKEFGLAGREHLTQSFINQSVN